MPGHFGRAAVWAFVLMTFGVYAAPAAGEEKWRLEQLMARLHGVKSASATFIEHKYLSVLNQPLVSSGTLHYIAPAWLSKVTAPPLGETMVLHDQILDDTQINGHHYSITVQNHPEVAALVEGILATLAGDLPTLQRYYEIGLTGSAAGWTLDLVPRLWLVRHKVSKIEIRGTQTWIREITVQERDGDHSDMIITPTGP